MNSLLMQMKLSQTAGAGEGSRNKAHIFDQNTPQASQTFKTFKSNLTDKTDRTEKKLETERSTRSNMKTPGKSDNKKERLTKEERNIKMKVQKLMNVDKELMEKQKVELSRFLIKVNDLLLIKGSEMINKNKDLEQMTSLRSTIELAKQIITQ